VASVPPQQIASIYGDLSHPEAVFFGDLRSFKMRQSQRNVNYFTYRFPSGKCQAYAMGLGAAILFATPKSITSVCVP
jgi:hypothetical protein